MKKGGCVYILANKSNNVLYIGVSSNLQKRLHQHINKHYPNAFTARYNCNKLVYYEFFSRIEGAIAREKAMKKWKRVWKENLINQNNPEWEDLSLEINEF